VAFPRRGGPLICFWSPIRTWRTATLFILVELMTLGPIRDPLTPPASNKVSSENSLFCFSNAPPNGREGFRFRQFLTDAVLQPFLLPSIDTMLRSRPIRLALRLETLCSANRSFAAFSSHPIYKNFSSLRFFSSITLKDNPNRKTTIGFLYTSSDQGFLHRFAAATLRFFPNSSVAANANSKGDSPRASIGRVAL
jgi:hypothetical protein